MTGTPPVWNEMLILAFRLLVPHNMKENLSGNQWGRGGIPKPNETSWMMRAGWDKEEGEQFGERIGRTRAVELRLSVEVQGLRFDRMWVCNPSRPLVEEPYTSTCTPVPSFVKCGKCIIETL